METRSIMKLWLMTIFLAVAVCGCATGTHILTGTAHPKIKAEAVVLYQEPPARYEVIGLVNATAPGQFQGNMDDALNQLKAHAAAMGANGIILGTGKPVGVGSATGGGPVVVSNFGIQLAGQAIYVPPAQ